MTVLAASCSSGSGAAADTTAPTVSSTSPTSGATDVAVSAVISATFSEPLDCASVTATAFTLTGGGAVAGGVTCSGATVTFTPAAPLQSNASHTATLGTAIRDLAGNALATGSSWSFTTLPARVLFGEDYANVYSVKEDGTGLATIADTLDEEHVATQWISYESNMVAVLGSPAPPLGRPNNQYRAPDTRPMVQGGRVVYQRYQRNDPVSPYANPVDIYAVNLDGTQRVALAATAAEEEAFAVVGDRLVYSSSDRTASIRNLRSVRLDGSGDVAITNITAQFQAAFAVAFVGSRLIFTEEGATGGTFISDADGSNRITLWGKQAYRVIVSNTRLLLGGRDMAAVNLDGTGFVAFTPTADLSGSGDAYAPSSLVFGIEAGRVFYSSVDQSVTPNIYKLVSVGLDGTNPLVLGSSTTTSSYVMEGVGGRLVVMEWSPAGPEVVSYEIARAGSRIPLLPYYRFMLLQGGRVVAYSPNGNDPTYRLSSVNPDGSAVATLALTASPLDSFHLVRLGQGHIVYAQTATNNQLEGYAVGLDGLGTVALTTGVAGDKELMDVVGGRLLFQSHTAGDLTASRNLHSVKLDGTGGLDHASTAADERYLGQFDGGSKLLFTSSSAGTVDLKVTPIAGGNSLLLRSNPALKTFVGAF